MSLLSSFRLHPSYFPLVPLAVPYWNRATYRNILGCLVSGQIIGGRELGKLKAALTGVFRAGNAILCGSGSLSLEIALRAFGVGQDDEVVIPTFCCSAVVSPITAVRAVPVLADVGDELNITAETVEAVLSGKTKAIIVPHLFGNPAEIAPIIDLARARNIHVIDDAAQALGATIDGHPVGGFGDAGVVSFGKEKICFGLGGGAVLFADAESAARAAKLRLQAPQRLAALRNFSAILVCHRWRRWSRPLQTAFSLAARNGPDTPPTRYRKEVLANLNAAVAVSLMETLQENIKARRTRAAAYQELLVGDERLELLAHRNGSACLTQVVRILPVRQNDDPALRVIEALNNAGYEVQGSYVPIHLLPGHKHCKAGRLPKAEIVWEHLIELPCEPDVSLSDVERIAAIIKQVVRGLKSGTHKQLVKQS